MTIFKAAVVQMTVSPDKMRNIDTVEQYLQQLESNRADVVVLPEMFLCPYKTDNFPVYAEEEGGRCWRQLSGLARRFQIYLVAGSMPERDTKGRIFNTSYVFNRQGEQIAKHRKLHLFDVNIEGGQYFQESATLTAGDNITVFDTEFGRMGLCICYDLRFPEIFRLMVEQGAEVIIVPGAFNMTTGPAHWEMLFRTRAVDNQVFLIGAAPARDLSGEYQSWGHSLMVDPWGRIITQMDEREGYRVRELELAEVGKVRQELPVLAHRRKDLYECIYKL